MFCNLCTVVSQIWHGKTDFWYSHRLFFLFVCFKYSHLRASLLSRWERICLQCRRPRFDPWVRKIHWRRGWPSTLIFFPGKPHGQRSLAAYSLWDHKELDTTEWLNTFPKEWAMYFWVLSLKLNHTQFPPFKYLSSLDTILWIRNRVLAFKSS